MKEINQIPAFKRFCMTVGNLPTAFMESMTYYEALQWLVNYIETVIIPTINNNGEAITELQEAFVTLKNYVDNYFDNLDIQTEINNKLDDMAESGELGEIIAQFLLLNTTYTYNNVAEMKEATNLVDGSFVRTNGYNTFGDGGAAYYKIRTYNVGDVIDEMTIIQINSETLIAELYKENIMNPTQFGAIGDGETDDTLAINTCINYSDNILFNNSTYLINPVYDENNPNKTCINLKSNKTIDFNNSKIVINALDDMLYYIIRCYQADNITIKNGFIEGYDLTEQDGNDSEGMGIAIMDCSNVNIENMNIKNCRGDGIFIREYSNQEKTNNVYIKDCVLTNNRRNQIGYTGGKNINIENCYIVFDINPSDTYTSNWVGINLERDHSYARFVDFNIDNCTIIGEPKAGFNLSPIDDTVPVRGFVRNIRIINCKEAITGSGGGAAAGDVVYENITIDGCTDTPIKFSSRGTSNYGMYFNNIVLNSFEYTGSEDNNYMFLIGGSSTKGGVGKVHINNPICKANCPLVFMNNGINNVSIVDPIFENGQSNNYWGVLGGRTGSSKLILKDSLNQIRHTISANYENSNIAVPSNLIAQGHTQIITVTIVNNLVSDGNEITIFNKGDYSVNVGMQGQRTITIPPYQGYCRVVKINGTLMFYGNLTRWEALPQQ